MGYSRYFDLADYTRWNGEMTLLAHNAGINRVMHQKFFMMCYIKGFTPQESVTHWLMGIGATPAAPIGS